MQNAIISTVEWILVRNTIISTAKIANINSLFKLFFNQVTVISVYYTGTHSLYIFVHFKGQSPMFILS